MMDEIFTYVILGIIAVIAVAYIVISIIKITKMTPDEKKAMLITYLKGLVAMAETTIGSGHGQEKMAMVEEYFNTKAPIVYKTILFLIGKDNLKELIETALAEIKDNFEK